MQVTQTYSPVTARADHSLLQYGFVEEMEEPLLAAVDSATGFDHEDDAWYGEFLVLSIGMPLHTARCRPESGHYQAIRPCLLQRLASCTDPH